MLDYSWITDRIAVGGGIWTAENMAAIARLGFTHIIDMQIEFDDTALAVPHGIVVLWNPTDDDFQPKPPELLRRGVQFALNALYPGPLSRQQIHAASRQEAAAELFGQNGSPAPGGVTALPGAPARLYVHCAAGVHRAAMMALAILRASGWSLAEAADLLVSRRNVVDLADVYVGSVENFMQSFRLTAAP